MELLIVGNPIGHTALSGKGRLACGWLRKTMLSRCLRGTFWRGTTLERACGRGKKLNFSRSKATYTATRFGMPSLRLLSVYAKKRLRISRHIPFIDIRHRNCTPSCPLGNRKLRSLTLVAMSGQGLLSAPTLVRLAPLGPDALANTQCLGRLLNMGEEATRTCRPALAECEIAALPARQL